MVALVQGRLFLASEIGWADVCFWETRIAALVTSSVSFILCPLSMIPIKPGSQIDTLVFFPPSQQADAHLVPPPSPATRFPHHLQFTPIIYIYYSLGTQGTVGRWGLPCNH